MWKMCLATLTAIALLAMSARAVEPTGADGRSSNDPNYPLDATTMTDVLRTRSPDEEAYIQYIAILVAQGRLPRDLVLGTFQWARGTPYPKKAQYFQHGLNTRAAEIGIHLPNGAPSLYGTVRGEVYTKVLLVKVPVAGATLTLAGTKFTTTSDSNGRFIFTDVPLGNYTLQGAATVALIPRAATIRLQLPSKPPSTEPLTVPVELR